MTQFLTLCGSQQLSKLIKLASRTSLPSLLISILSATFDEWVCWWRFSGGGVIVERIAIKWAEGGRGIGDSWPSCCFGSFFLSVNKKHIISGH